jgi:hydrogenase maturation protease HycI
VQNLRKTLGSTLSSTFTAIKKIAILGIGSELRGDDAAGIAVTESLKRSLARSRRHLPARIFTGFTAPENLTGEIKRYRPSHIIMIDTADFGEAPGTVVVLDPMDVGSGVSFSTHKMPAKILVDYLRKSLACEVTVIGIQPEKIDFGKPLSKKVAAAAKEVAGALSDILKKR